MIFKFLLFLFCINLHNSFKIISYVNHKYHNRLSVGCDYYIEQRLYINYNDGCYCINLHRKTGYYTYTDIYNDFIMGKTIENNKLSELEKIKQYHLTPKTKPFIIYNNHTFTNIDVSNKYKAMLEFEITNNYYKTWDDIKNIVFLEERYEKY